MIRVHVVAEKNTKSVAEEINKNSLFTELKKGSTIHSRKSVEEKSTLWKSNRENRQSGQSPLWCERFSRKAVEDHLGVALIQPGDSVIIK